MESKNILIVEDDEIALKALNNFSKKRKLNADLANNYDDAVQYVKNNPDKYNVILTDFNLESATGVYTAYDLSKKLKMIAGNKLGKLIVMSADDLNEDEYKEHGFSFFLEKPITKKVFEKTMDKLGL